MCIFCKIKRGFEQVVAPIVTIGEKIGEEVAGPIKQVVDVVVDAHVNVYDNTIGQVASAREREPILSANSETSETTEAELFDLSQISIELVEGTDAADLLSSQNPLAITFLDGKAGDDSMYGGAGIDALFGQAGNDVLYGGGSIDLLHGAEGNDTIYGGNGLSDTADDADLVFGGEGNDVIYGNGGTDILFGEAGDDLIYGGVGNDTLVGGNGADTLIGGEGADVIIGGRGNDHLWGGEGADVFLFGHDDKAIGATRFQGAEKDIIYDFEVGVDKLYFWQTSTLQWKGYDTLFTGATGVYASHTPEGTLLSVETDGLGGFDYSVLLVGVNTISIQDIGFY